MALATAAIQTGAAAIAGAIDTLKVHTGDPGAAGTANTTTAAPQTVTATASGGNITIPSTNFTGGAASGPCTYVSYWAGSTFYGSEPLSGDQTFNAAGEYTVDSVTINGSSPS